MNSYPDRRRAVTDWIGVTRAGLWLMSLVLLTALAMSISVHATSQSIVGQVTARTSITLPNTASSSTVQGVMLAGLGSEPTGLPDVVSLIWTKQESAWIPTWVLQLHSKQGTLPVQTRQPITTNRTFGTQAVTLATVTPQWGATYQTAFSYDPDTGLLSIRVHNATNNVLVYRGDLVLPSLETHYHVSAGTVITGSGTMHERFHPAEDVLVDPVFVPWGVQWGPVRANEGRPESVEVTRIDRLNTPEVGIRLDLPAPTPGTFDFWLKRGSERTLIARVDGTVGSTFVPLNIDELPLGPFDLVMEYRTFDKVWLTESRSLLFGQVSGQVSMLHYDQNTRTASGTLTLQADGPFPERRVTLHAELFHMVWNKERIRYDRVPSGTVPLIDTTLALNDQPMDLPFTIPAPSDSNGLWEVRFTLEPGIDVPISIEGQDRLFATYQPAEIADGQPFMIAVIPDTQYYSLQGPQGGHPDMFIRQMEWIAANARSLNIGLALHVGDITQLNTPDQWEVAQKSIRLLDGVVPYVLAIGNHDLGDEKGESRDTRLNTYFPPSRYETLPTFGGLLQPGELENSYHRFELAGKKYLVVSLEFLPRDPALEWANEIVAAHPDHEVILLTHTYTGTNGRPRTAYGATPEKGIEAWGEVHTGYEIWNEFVRHHPNMFMVLSGHVHHDTVARGMGWGIHGNPIFEMLFCYQLSPNGGDGWMGLLQVLPEDDLIGVTVYSPTREEVKEESAGGFEVPFCIDVAEGRYRPVDAACAVDLTEATAD